MTTRRKHEIEKVIWSTGLRSSAGHFESAERDAGPTIAPVMEPIDVEISDHKFRTHALDVLWATRVEASREGERCMVGNLRWPHREIVRRS